MYLRCAFVVLALATGALAGPKVELADTTFLGNGCKKNAEVRIAPNAKRIDFYFSDFTVAADNIADKPGSSECKATLRLKVPHGFSVAVLRVKYRGTYELGYGASAHLLGLLSVNGNASVLLTKRYGGFVKGDFSAQKVMTPESMDWSPCGEDVVFTAATTIALSMKKSLQEGSFQLMSSEKKPALTYYLAWRLCKETFS